MTATAEQYESVLEEWGGDTESLTVLVVSGASRELVAQVLGVDLATTIDPWDVGGDAGAYALAEVAGGVLAIELTGYPDPTNESLRLLSADGRRAAVVRDNIQAHVRFGCARDGQLVLGDDEYAFIREPARVPDELRPLFDRVWVDPDGDDDDSGPGWITTALAMAEVATGVTLTAADLERVSSSTFHPAPGLVYAG